MSYSGKFAIFKREDSIIEVRFFHAVNKDQSREIRFLDTMYNDSLIGIAFDLLLSTVLINRIIFIPMLTKIFDMEESNFLLVNLEQEESE